MQSSRLSNIKLVPAVHEQSNLHSPREPGSMQHLWKFINDISHVVNGHSDNINQAAREIEKVGGRNKFGFDLYPFKIYILPDAFRGGYGPDNWRTVRVRGGFVFTDTIATASYVQGTDLFQNYAYANNYPLSASYDILIPTGSTNNPVWVWIEKSTSGSPPVGEKYNYYLRYGNNPISSSLGNPAPWTTFPAQNSNYIPVGLVDGFSSASIFQLNIRQFLTNDVLSSGGSNNLITTYNESSSYNVGDGVVVDCNVSYSANLSFQPPTSSTRPALCAGYFQCRFNVPTTSSRDPFVISYPIYPVPGSSSMVIVSGSIRNNYCWFPVTPMLPTCLPAPYGLAFVAMQVSSSQLSFPNTQLPYHP